MEPPETLTAGELLLKRWEPDFAVAAAAAVRESLPELRPFMAWATEGHDVAASLAYIEKAVGLWAKGEEFSYAIFTPAGELVGSIGLMTRMGPGVLEIGYWLRTAFTGRGYMTAAVDTLTRVGLTLPGIERVGLRHDAANVRSAAVAERAGFVEVKRYDHEPEAPGHSGVEVLRERRS